MKVGSALEWTAGSLRADALAGLLGAVLALPQGIAFAKLAGLPPQYGIYSAIVPCAVAAIFGSSKHVVSGPTNANSLALFAALSPLALVGGPEYIGLALAATALVGASQLAVGVMRLAWLTDFIAPAVLLGFISGAAILIGLHAVPDVLGADAHGGRAFDVLRTIPAMLADINPTAAIVAVVTLVATVALARVSRRLPFMLFGIICGFAASRLLAVGMPQLQPAMTIGAIPSVIPPFSLPSIPLELVPKLVYVSGALSIVALGQSVSIAKALAQRSGQRIDIDQEFVGQGLSNLIGSVFSCYVSCGSLNRSLPNLLAGARSSMAAVFSAVFLLLLAFFTRPLLQQIPLAAVGALLIFIAYGLVDVAQFRRLWLASRADWSVAIVTLVTMLVLPFENAILIGSALALACYLHHTSHPVIKVLAPDAGSRDRIFKPLEDLGADIRECPQLKLVRIEGAVYFGAAGVVSRMLETFKATGQRHLLVMARSMNFNDMSGVDLWQRELATRRADGGGLYFHRPREKLLQGWKRSGFENELGSQNIFHSKRDAIGAITAALDPAICARCRVRLFKECDGLPDDRVRSAAQREASRLPDRVV